MVRIASILVAACLLANPAAAADVHVLVSAAFKPVVAAMAPGFEKRTGHKVRFVEDVDFDLAVLPEIELERLGKDGVVADGSITRLARETRETYAGALSTSAANSNAAMSLLILLSSEETQAILKSKGLSAP
jgi:ABC-type molybdate transport system substrate-binding protein